MEEAIQQIRADIAGIREHLATLNGRVSRTEVDVKDLDGDVRANTDHRIQTVAMVSLVKWLIGIGGLSLLLSIIDFVNG